MKKTVIFILILVSYLNLNAQRNKIIESKTFNDITVTLLKVIESEKYHVVLTVPSSNPDKKHISIPNKKSMYKLMSLIIAADKRKSYSEFIKWKYGYDKFTIMVRHAKKSDYIGIGRLNSFKYGNYGVLRKNARSLYDYLNKQRKLLPN